MARTFSAETSTATISLPSSAIQAAENRADISDAENADLHCHAPKEKI